MKVIVKKPIGEVSSSNLLRNKYERIHKIKFIDHTSEIMKKSIQNRTFAKIANKRIAYSPEARNILRKCTGLLKDIHELAKNPNKLVHEVKGTNKSGDKFSYKIMKSEYVASFSENSNRLKKYSNATNTFYKVMIDINGKKTKLFGKFMNDMNPRLNKVQAFNEISALHKLQKMGYRIVKPYLGYFDKTEHRSFMFYEFKNMGHYRVLQDLLDSTHTSTPLMDSTDILKIKKKIEPMTNQEEQKLGFGDCTLRNVMIDIRTKKLYLFDMIDSNLQLLEHMMDWDLNQLK